MTQIEQVKAEIERRMAEYKKVGGFFTGRGIGPKSSAVDYYYMEDEAILSFIESQEKEQPKEPTIKSWVARTKCGRIFLYETKPKRASDFWFEKNARFQEIDNDAFPDLKWEDEPIEVELTINRI